MILKWVKSVIGSQRTEAIQQGAVEEEKRRKENKLIDVAHEVLSKEAAERSAELDGLVKYGWPHVKREKFKRLVRRKVHDIVDKNFGTEGDEIIDEVTEKIVDTAEVDPYYQKMFEEKAENKD